MKTYFENFITMSVHCLHSCFLLFLPLTLWNKTDLVIDLFNDLHPTTLHLIVKGASHLIRKRVNHTIHDIVGNEPIVTRLLGESETTGLSSCNLLANIKVHAIFFILILDTPVCKFLDFHPLSDLCVCIH